jgi:predicted house-cleaning noncanonical NTP pyrophosphatase (MazG superfamily)
MRKYNKLVRDKIPQIIKSKGGKFKLHIAQDLEYWQMLKKKLMEEFKEFSKHESEEEYADILEVVEAIGKYKKFNFKEVQRIKIEKFKKRGGFKKRIILEES